MIRRPFTKLTGFERPIRFHKTEIPKWKDCWVGIYFGEHKSYLSGIWRRVYICPLPFICVVFEVYRPDLFMGLHGIERR